MITTQDAATHLRLDGNYEPRELALKLGEALAITYRYLGIPAAPYPYDVDGLFLENPSLEIPPVYPTAEEANNALYAEAAKWQDRGIDAAVLLVLGELWANRESGTADPLTPAVKRVLDLYKKTVFA